MPCLYIGSKRMMRKVEVVPHNPEWQNLFVIEAKAIAEILESNLVEIYHIGSTSIPGIYAKPIIDLLVAVKEIDKVDRHNTAMGNLGYEVMGEFGMSDRRFFRKDNFEGKRTHHVHIFPANSPQILRHLTFRDYLIAHPLLAQKYSDLKRQLAQQYPNDIDSYMDGKDEFIKEIDRQALEWNRTKK